MKVLASAGHLAGWVQQAAEWVVTPTAIWYLRHLSPVKQLQCVWATAGIEYCALIDSHDDNVLTECTDNVSMLSHRQAESWKIQLEQVRAA